MYDMNHYETQKNSWLKWLYGTPKDRSWGLHVVGAGVTVVVPHEEFFMGDNGRMSDHYGIIYLLSGKGIYRSKEVGEVPLEAGNAFMYFPNVWHRYRPNPDTGWREFWVTFAGYYPDRLLEQGMISPRNPVLDICAKTPIKDLFGRLFDCALQEPSLPHPILSATVYEILATAVCGATSSVGEGLGTSQDVMQAKHYLEENVDRPVPIVELANVLSMSSRNLHYAFKEATGIAPHQYHMRIRMARAKEMLGNSTLMIKEIARRLGFQDQYYFSRVFKRHTGCSPEEWRETKCPGRDY